MNRSGQGFDGKPLPRSGCATPPTVVKSACAVGLIGEETARGSSVSRLLVMLLALVGLTLVTGPAQAGQRATVTVTVHASATSVHSGEPVTFHGKARGAISGTRLNLQRQDAAGSWTTLATAFTGSVRPYALTILPVV